MTFDVENTIRRRKSVRAYENRPLSQSDRDRVNALITELGEEDTPFPARITMRLLEPKKSILIWDLQIICQSQ